MSNEQLINRNHVEFSDMVYVFLELNSVYDNQFTLYLDTNGWELFDIRTGKSIIHHQFKHFRQFTFDMKKLMRDIINVGSANIRVNRDRKPKPSEVWSIKSLLKIYPLSDNYLFNDNLKNYFLYGIKSE